MSSNYKCEVCGKEFDEEELEQTNDKNKCILHCEKEDWYKVENTNKIWNSKKVNIFWKEIKENLNSLYETSFYESSILKEEYLFKEIIFPKFQKNIKYCNFKDNLNDLGTNFYDYNFFEKPNIGRYEELNTVFKKLRLKFYKCVFLDDSDFTRYNFEKDVLFHKCTFKGNLNFSKNIFINKFKFVDCEVEGIAYFYRTKFDKIVAFDKTKFNEVNFRNCRFNNLARFVNTEFKKKIDFKYTYFYKNCVFNEMKIRNKINLEKTIFFEKVNFYKITYNLNCVENRETARIIKDSFEQQNNIIEANKFYAIEMQKREEELDKEKRNGKNFFDWLIFKVHGLASNHSQDSLLALFWILIFSFTYGFINCLNESLDTKLEYFLVDSFIIGTILLISIWVVKKENINNFYLVLCFYIFYSFFSKDFTLYNISNNINPFSIMTGLEELSFLTLLYKISIAFLIYQFIISIRQNTRRK